MKLLLKRSVAHLGTPGDIVQVRRGYARNYLIPQGLALEVNPGNLQWFEAQKRRLIQQEEEVKTRLRLLAKELDGASCTIIARATEEGHLFGSVAPRDIAGHFTQEGIAIDPRCILLEKPIKELGIYKVTVQLHPDISAEVKVWVVKGDEDLAAAGAAPAASDS